MHFGKILSVCLFTCSVFAANSQAFTITDNFADRTKFIDNTLLTLWGGNTVPTTGLNLVNRTAGSVTLPSITLSAAGLANSGYVTTSSLKTLTSFDYEFPSSVNRFFTTIEVQFDATWASLNSSGESGRIVVTLVDDLPAGGAGFEEVLNTALPDPFGKPIYNVRIRNNSSASNGSMILYGADDNNPHPEWEIYTSGGDNWWLPGFSVQSGGGSPGSGPNYPGSGTRKATSIITSSTAWRQYRILFEQRTIRLYSRNYGATTWVEDNNMYIPFDTDPNALNQINSFHGTSATVMPPAYDWFQFANAIRFYYRGGSQAWIANVNITATVDPILPIHITSWKATKTANGQVLLAWRSADTDKFIVEHSTDGRNFLAIGEREGHGDGSKEYQLMHASPYNGKNYYRLKSYDAGGQVSYSGMQVVHISKSGAFRLYPNPVATTLYFEGLQANDGKHLLRIFGTDGRVIKQAFVQAGQPVPVGSLQAGLYFYELRLENRRLQYGRFQKL